LALFRDIGHETTEILRRDTNKLSDLPLAQWKPFRGPGWTINARMHWRQRLKKSLQSFSCGRGFDISLLHEFGVNLTTVHLVNP
jgi:hypothetical protein